MPKPLPEILEYFLSDCLERDKNYTTKRMFSGYGVFYKWKIFAIYAMERLYFKVWEQNKQDFLDAGSEIFKYEKQAKQAHISYYTLPEELFDDREELYRWIVKALDY